jgi:DNA-binding MarR family transcriptional regulator
MLLNMTQTPAPLATVLDLSLARTLVLRDVDASLGAHHGVSLGDLAILLELRDAPGQRLRRVELANRLGITPSGLARQLQPLERIGVVARESHARDARLALVVLTDAGARIADDGEASGQLAAERALEKRWTPAERDQLAALLAAART